MEPSYIITLSCPDRTGIVAKVTSLIAKYDGWIIEASQHADTCTDYFFMRVQIKAQSLSCSIDEFKGHFKALADELSLQWEITDTSIKKRIVIFVSKKQHCLSDLLYRWRSGEFHADISAVISNHDDLRQLVEWHELPYHHIPINPDNKTESFQQIEQLMQQYPFDVAILARYMQILPPTITEKYFGKIINIHHSFLPSFHGGNAYQQAYDRGVKLAGATSHYVTEILDEGPIIEQDVTRISHHQNVDDIARLTRDIEKTVLAKALHNHLQDRILIHNNKTIVFE